jgi:hypothetical protein
VSSTSSWSSKPTDISTSHTTVTLGFHHDEAAFVEEARRHARKHGYLSREEWKYELLDLDEEHEEESSGSSEEDSDAYSEEKLSGDELEAMALMED